MDSGSDSGDDAAAAAPLPLTSNGMTVPAHVPQMGAMQRAYSTDSVALMQMQMQRQASLASAAAAASTLPHTGVASSAAAASAAPKKRAPSTKPRVPRPKKARAEDGTAPPGLQRSVSSRKARDAPAFNRPLSLPSGGMMSDIPLAPPAEMVQTAFSSSAALGTALWGRRDFNSRVLAIAPGSDTIKIGWAESEKPVLVRTMLAHRLKAAQPPASAPVKAEDEEMKDASVPAPSLPARLSHFDTLAAQSEADERALSNEDKQLLGRWRRKRDHDLAAAEKALAKLSGMAGPGRKASAKASALAADKEVVVSSIRLAPAEGSIHDVRPSSDFMLAPEASPEDFGPALVGDHRPLVSSTPPKHVGPPTTLFASDLLAAIPVKHEGAVYDPRNPMSRGQFDVARLLLRQSVDDLTAILRETCRSTFSLESAQDFRGVSVSVAVPEGWTNAELAAFVDSLLLPQPQGLGFREVFLQRESTAACFGAGLASACVVDIGASTITVGCVHEGVMQEASIRRLSYGGADIDDLLRSSIDDKTFWSEFEQLLEAAAQTGVHAENQLSVRMAEKIRRWKEQYAYCLASDVEEPPLGAPQPASSHVSVNIGHFVSQASLFAPAGALGLAPASAAPLPARRAPLTVPAELLHAAPLCTLGLWHPTLFYLSLSITRDRRRDEELRRVWEHLDPDLDAFAASPFAAHSLAAIRAALPPRTFDAALILDEEVNIGSTGEGGRVSGGRSRKRISTLIAESPQKAAPPAAAAAASAAPIFPTAPVFKLDRRRKDHQLLLQSYTEEQLMAGEHLEADAMLGAPASAVSHRVHAFAPLSLDPFLVARMPLHHAVASSIQSVPGGAGVHQLMASTILLAGGGASLPQLVDAFEERLVDLVPYVVPGANTINCVLNPKGQSSAALSWRGAGIVARAESTREGWISSEEWQRCGAKLLREKCPFPV